MGLFHYYDVSYSEIFVFDDYAINQIRNNEDIKAEHRFMTMEIIDKHFKNKPFVYIANRVQSYTLRPELYEAVDKITNMVGIVIIVDTETFVKIAESEKQYHTKPHLVCSTLNEAIVWASQLVKKAKK